MTKPGIRFGGAFPVWTAWLVLLFLLLGVLAPTACVLWFMNEAVRSQSESARRAVAAVYRGQLWLTRDRIDSFWPQQRHMSRLTQTHSQLAPPKRPVAI